jgi:hypothetical protein
MLALISDYAGTVALGTTLLVVAGAIRGVLKARKGRGPG